MIKHSLVAALFLALMVPVLPGQSIVVTSPKGGEKLNLTHILKITWTSSGVSGPMSIKLRLADAPMADPVLSISNNSEENGTYSWNIPPGIAAGRYIIRVRTASANPIVHGDSKPFTIMAAAGASGSVSQNNPNNAVQPQGLPPGTANVNNANLQTIDFEMLDVERETGSGVIFAKLRNKGSRAYNGPLTFLVLFGSDRLDPITVPVNLAAGATGMVNLMYYLSPLDLAMRGSVLVKIVADSDTKILEMNELNNAASRTIAKTCPVYIKSFEIEVTPSHSTGPYPLPVTVTMRLDVIGQGELEIKADSINNASSTRKYQFPASGSYEFVISQMNVLAAWLAPNAQKPNCRFEYAICPVIKAWVVGACADGGQIRSNEVGCRYEQQP